MDAIFTPNCIGKCNASQDLFEHHVYLEFEVVMNHKGDLTPEQMEVILISLQILY